MRIIRGKAVNPANSANNEINKVLVTFKNVFVSVGVYSFIINILMLVPSIYMLQVYDRVLTSRNKETLLMVTLIAVFMYIMMASLEWIRSQIVIRTGLKIDQMLSEKTFSSAFKSSINVGPGAASQAFQDLTSVRQFVTGNGLFAFFDAPWAPIYLIVIFLLHPALGLLALTSSIILILLTLLTELISKSVLSEANTEFRKASAFANMNFRNAEAIDAMGMVDDVKKHWIPKHQSFIDKQTIASRRAASISAVTRFVRISSQSLVFFVGSYYVLKFELSAGAMIAGSILMGRALAPVEMVMSNWKNFLSARGSYKKLNELYNIFPSGEEKMNLPKPAGKLTVQGVFATAPNAQMHILKGVSFNADEGEMLAVIGPSASGKSTLARVLVGVWSPPLGEVRLDGVNVSKWDKSSMGKYVGYLPQSIELLEGTIAENIARFSEVDADKVVEAAKKAGVHEMILALPEGYDTYIGEGGVVLSGGQRQRVALARALYDNPVFIVLDEPNSNLDEVGDMALVQCLKSLKAQGTTVVVITHKTTLLSIVDKILVLSAGSVQMFGSRNDVLNALKQRTEQARAAAVQQQAPRTAPINNTVPIKPIS